MPISLGNAGQTYVVSRITGKEETRQFLETLGFVPGTSVTIISSIGGNVIIEVRDSRIAVNNDMAKHIIV